MDEIAETVADVKVGKVNVDEEEELAAKFGIMSIPTILAFKDGKLVNQTIGVQPKESILSMVGK
jgi:thioredoxin 1